jgi:hypothetical protein
MKAPRALFLLPLLGSCGIVDPVVCTTDVTPAVEVQVFDARTGAPAAHGTLATAQDGSYTDTLEITGWRSTPADSTTAFLVTGAYERPGTYTVRISKPGYKPWERTRVHAREGECGVERVQLVASLEPAA